LGGARASQLRLAALEAQFAVLGWDQALSEKDMSRHRGF
jgi:hypothetical protein